MNAIITRTDDGPQANSISMQFDSPAVISQFSFDIRDLGYTSMPNSFGPTGFEFFAFPVPGSGNVFFINDATIPDDTIGANGDYAANTGNQGATLLLFKKESGHWVQIQDPPTTVVGNAVLQGWKFVVTLETRAALYRPTVEQLGFNFIPAYSVIPAIK